MKIRIAEHSDGVAIANIYTPIVKDTFISFEETPTTASEMSGSRKGVGAMSAGGAFVCKSLETLLCRPFSTGTIVTVSGVTERHK
jgi:L-amino acid N-acyltransferase YncA